MVHDTILCTMKTLNLKMILLQDTLRAYSYAPSLSVFKPDASAIGKNLLLLAPQMLRSLFYQDSRPGSVRYYKVNFISMQITGFHKMNLYLEKQYLPGVLCWHLPYVTLSVCVYGATQRCSEGLSTHPYFCF